MAEQRVSLACTTYQTGKLMLFGRKPDGDLAGLRAELHAKHGAVRRRPDALDELRNTSSGGWRTCSGPARPTRATTGFSSPELGITTGDLDIHDIAVESTRPSGLRRHRLQLPGDRATSGTASRRSGGRRSSARFAAEDRCHLNGLALEDWPLPLRHGRGRDRPGGGLARCIDGTAAWCWKSPRARRWRSGLSMPHSPRLHRGRLWVLNSGTGFLGTIDRDRGRFEPVAFCPGYPPRALVRGRSITPSSAFRGLATTRPSAASRSTSAWRSATRRRGAACS